MNKIYKSKKKFIQTQVITHAILSDNDYKNFQVSEDENAKLNNKKYEDVSSILECSENNYSAVAPDAKWDLEILFDKNSLKPPTYLNLYYSNNQ
ncbi:2692_t:CDS:2 [Cetraspora pellucida]|uniref:2692_t:CDS:1 n=1 Tax=Cetraspora pellucida TaxID=1433469 RepID=A0ACA9LFW0_9GLOM|nr:2692_t:CDS:2 [Cetraspora pellucida]